MNKKLKFFITVTFFLLVPYLVFCQSPIIDLGIPDGQPSDNLLNTIFLEKDWEDAFSKTGRNDTCKLGGASGWVLPRSTGDWGSVVTGISQGWVSKSSPKFYLTTKFGFFENSQDARDGALIAIGTRSPSMIFSPKESSFSGAPIGDKTFCWELAYEKARGFFPNGVKGDKAILSFSKGKYSALVGVGSDEISMGGIDRRIVEGVAHKALEKIKVATALDAFGSDLAGLITQTGLLRSLQAKLDVFTKNCRKGEYKTALNNINAFINELNAQRGKHVSEPAYQTLKGYADTIIQSLNTLM